MKSRGKFEQEVDVIAQKHEWQVLNAFYTFILVYSNKPYVHIILGLVLVIPQTEAEILSTSFQINVLYTL